MKNTQLSAYGIPFMSSNAIRKAFIDFFVQRDHRFIRSDSVAPSGDPTILFTNSGMNQFKGIFLGNNPQGLKRAVNSQKCLRVSGKHNDLEEVGLDGTHHTFFEMLGNWSFGDYYKKEAIVWAWQLLTEVLKLPKNRLFVTVHVDDDEAFDIWAKHTDIEPWRIMRFREQNFWEMGPVGPCGPCSEINFDRGDLATQQETFNDPIEGVNGQNERYVEIWNLVFMQNERHADGSLSTLPDKHVDTGSGLERVTSIVQGKSSNYETDAFWPIIEAIAKITGRPYGADAQGNAHRVIADHLRALCFAIADGVTPANEGRGYVMRRILRRASRFASMLGQKDPMIYSLVKTLVQMLGDSYPELVERQKYIEQVIESEEKRFLKTLSQGLAKIEAMLEGLTKKNKTHLSGEDVFLLHDTFGFPSDLTALICRERGFKIEEEAFLACMENQREKARSASKFKNIFADEKAWVRLSEERNTEFSGYEITEESVKTLAYLEDGDDVYIVLQKTPFYAESGGQVGDQGTLENAELALRVIDTFKVTDMYIHRCSLVKGLVNAKTVSSFNAKVDRDQREKTRRNHSATHLLHAALREILGTHVAQQGSYVGPDRLRFDFSHPNAISDATLAEIEVLVNEKIQENLSVSTKIEEFEEAKRSGAMALFGEKYADKVRVLTMGSFSKELCGGTHVRATGDIGYFRIVQETSIAAGVRRIEGLTGQAAVASALTDHNSLQALAGQFKCQKSMVEDKVVLMLKRQKELEKKLVELKQARIDQIVETLSKQERLALDNFYAVCTPVSRHVVDKDDLQLLLDAMANKLNDGIAVLTHTADDQMSILVAVGRKASEKYAADALLKQLMVVCGAKGGGKKDRARAGTKEVHKQDEVLRTARRLLSEGL